MILLLLMKKIKCDSLLGVFITLTIISTSCGKKTADKTPLTPPPPSSFSSTLITVNGKQETSLDYNINTTPVIKFSFSAAIDHASANNNFSFATSSGIAVPFNATYSNGDSVVIIQSISSLNLSSLVKILKIMVKLFLILSLANPLALLSIQGIFK